MLVRKHGNRASVLLCTVAKEWICKLGYRFDTLLANFSNKALVIGENVSGYEDFY